jgi:excisionase family DNA binding protein
MADKIRIPKKPNMPGRGVEETSPPRSLRLLSVRGAADHAQVSTQTVRRAIKSGELKFYRMRRQIRIDGSDLVGYLSARPTSSS